MIRRAARTAGFTILEILIAIVILVIGITGIVALFPTAIESGNKTVEDSYAAAITQSVIDAISVGLRESKYSYQASNGLNHYFILDHDGVLDAPMADGKVSDYTASDSNTPANLWKRDFTILLPKTKVADNTDVTVEPIFCYPGIFTGTFTDSTIGTLDDARQPSALGSSNPSDDQAPGVFYKMTYKSTKDWWYRRTFPLGRYRAGSEPSGGGITASDWTRQIRMEFLGAQLIAGANKPENYTVIDPYPQYSFAIAIKRAKIDNSGPGGVPDGKIGPEDKFSDNLYEVRILIFRNFDGSETTQKQISGPNGIIPKVNVPIREFVTLMSI